MLTADHLPTIFMANDVRVRLGLAPDADGLLLVPKADLEQLLGVLTGRAWVITVDEGITDDVRCADQQPRTAPGRRGPSCVPRADAALRLDSGGG